MTINEKRPNPVPPYVAFRTLQGLLDDFREHGIPSQIDKSVLKSMSGAVQSQVRVALRYLGLTDSADKTTPIMRQLVEARDDERKQVLRAIVEKSYEFIFGDSNSFDLSMATMQQLEAKFRDQGIQGDTVNKAVTFFVRACQESNIVISKFITNTSRRPSGERTGKPRAQNINPTKRLEHSEETQTDVPAGTGERNSDKLGEFTFEQRLMQTLVDKFPSFDAAGSDEMKAKWYENYMAMMKMLRESNAAKD